MAGIGHFTSKTTREVTTPYPAPVGAVKNFLHDAPDNAQVFFAVQSAGPMSDDRPTTLKITYSFEEDGV